MTSEIAQMQETPAVANNDVVSLQISLPQMLDLALGTPEVGAVNFNLLHNFLRVLLHQINLQTTKVEYRGESADRIKAMVTSLKPGPAVHLHEYSITDGNGKILQRTQEDDEMDVEVLTEGTELPADDSLKVTKGVRQHVGPGNDSEAEKVIFVEPIVNGAPPTALAFKELEQSVKQLQQQYQALEEFSTTPEVVERLKGQIKDPVADMWQFININKRLDANEQGIDKLTTMVQDVIKGDISVAPITDASLINVRLDELEDKVSKLEKQLIDLQIIVGPLIKDTSPIVGNDIDAITVATEETVAIDEEPDMDVMIAATEETAETAEVSDVDVVTAATEETFEKIDEDSVPLREKEEPTKAIPKATADIIPARRVTDEIGIVEMRRDVETLKKDVTRVQQELRDLNEKVAQIEAPKITVVEGEREKPVTVEAITDKERIDEAVSLEQCLEAVRNVEATHGEALQNVTQRVVTLEKEVDNLLEKMESIEGRTDDIDIKEFVTRIRDVETDADKFGQALDRLLDEKEDRDIHINTLLTQVEVLKTIKADKEDLEDALADKADTQTVDRKVSHDRFDAACDSLTRGLEEAIDKLSKQELFWQQALDEIQNEVAGKVDKIEMTPLKNFMHSKLKSLHEKLKIIAEARREIEAAGTKKQLKDVQCISCNKDVVMKMEEVSRFRAESFPCTASIKPYLTYKLDQIRKQQKRLPHSRNMMQFEAAVQEEVRKMKRMREEMLPKIPRDHLCNRYCGGSHTVTTPQQRVTRTGHFLTQWGPEIVQLTDGLIKGKDGQMYRSRPIPGKLEVSCGPMSCWESQISEETRFPERTVPASTPTRKSLPTRRNSAGSQRRNSRKSSKEPRISEPAEKPIEMTSPQESDRPLLIPAGSQDDIVLYETAEWGRK